MEFRDVVRRRRMVPQVRRPAGRPRARRPGPAPRHPRAERRLQPGLGLPRAGLTRRRRRVLGRHRRPATRSPTPGCRDAHRAGRDRAVQQQGGVPRPLRRARQGLDRPRRGPLAGAVLAPRHRDGDPADPAHRRRRGARRLLLRHPARAGRRGEGRFGIPDAFDPIGAVTLGHRCRTPAPRARRRPGAARTRPRSCTAGMARRSASAEVRSTRGWAGLGCAHAGRRVVAKLQALVRIPTVSDRDPATDRHRRLRRLPRRAGPTVPAAARTARADPDPAARPALPLAAAGRPSRPGRADGAPRRRARRPVRAVAAPGVRRRRSSTARSGAAARSTTRAAWSASARPSSGCSEQDFTPAQDVWLSFGCDEEVSGGAARAAVAELTPARACAHGSSSTRAAPSRTARSPGSSRRGRHRRHREGRHVAARSPRRAAAATPRPRRATGPTARIARAVIAPRARAVPRQPAARRPGR